MSNNETISTRGTKSKILTWLEILKLPPYCLVDFPFCSLGQEPDLQKMLKITLGFLARGTFSISARVTLSPSCESCLSMAAGSPSRLKSQLCLCNFYCNCMWRLCHLANVAEGLLLLFFLPCKALNVLAVSLQTNIILNYIISLWILGCKVCWR